jgi:hypothetical protein
MTGGGNTVEALRSIGFTEETQKVATKSEKK